MTNHNSKIADLVAYRIFLGEMAESVIFSKSEVDINQQSTFSFAIRLHSIERV
jgi:hypothetical protein